MSSYIGINGRAREVTDIYIGVNGKARKVTDAYIGVDGKARPIYTSDQGEEFRFTTEPLNPATDHQMYVMSIKGKGSVALSGVDNAGNKVVVRKYFNATHFSHIDFSEEEYSNIVGNVEIIIKGQPTDLNLYASYRTTILNATLKNISKYMYKSIYTIAPHIISIDTPIPSSMNWASFYQKFMYSKIRTLPLNMFVNCPDSVWYNYCFGNCTNLTTLPASLFSDKARGKYDFSSCFESCNLGSIPSTFFEPLSASKSLDGNCHLGNMTRCFASCYNLTGLAPELWDTNNFPGTDGYKHTACFRSCTRLANYSDIPSDWK